MDDQLKERVEAVNNLLTIPQVIPALHLGSNDCPNCGGKNKLSVSPQVARCWKPGCSWHDGLPMVKFYQEYHRYSRFTEALLELENTAGISHDQTKMIERSQILSKLKNTYQLYLNLTTHSEVRDYLFSRGITAESIDSLGIGYAPHNQCVSQLNKISQAELDSVNWLNQDREFFSNRIVFPLYDFENRLQHFQGRYYGDIPEINGSPVCGKYKNTAKSIGIPSSQSYLALEQYLDSYPRTCLYICEGFPDTISLWQMGLPAVGVLGLTGINNHIAKFRKFDHLIFCFDNDRFEADHPKANQYKSWIVVIPQLIELQQKLPAKQLSVFIPPAESGIKDINDLVLIKSEAEVKEILIDSPQELVALLTKTWGKKIEKHHLLIPLLKIKNKIHLLQPYTQNLTTVEYASRILEYAS